MKTQTYKDMRGNWNCRTILPLCGNRVLEILTHKVYTKELVTTVRAKIFEGSFVVYTSHDFSRTISYGKIRVTEKTVRAKHDLALLTIDSVLIDARSHYRLPMDYHD